MLFAASLSENFFAISMPSSSSAAPATQRHWKFDCATLFGAFLFASLILVCQAARSQCSAESAMQAA